MRATAPPLAGWTVALLATTLLSGCAATPPTGPGGSPTVTTARPSLPDDTPGVVTPPPTNATTGETTGETTGGGPCGARPTARGPADNLLVVAISAPATAPSGGTVTVSSRLVVLSGGPRVVLTTQGSSVEVLRGSTVVARTPAAAGPDVPLPLTAGASFPGQALPTQVSLTGCDGTPLAPGAYSLRAVVAYGGDPLGTAPGDAGGAGRFVLVSDPPTDLTVT